MLLTLLHSRRSKERETTAESEGQGREQESRRQQREEEGEEQREGQGKGLGEGQGERQEDGEGGSGGDGKQTAVGEAAKEEVEAEEMETDEKQDKKGKEEKGGEVEGTKVGIESVSAKSAVEEDRKAVGDGEQKEEAMEVSSSDGAGEGKKDGDILESGDKTGQEVEARSQEERRRLPWLAPILQGALCHLFQRFALEGDKSNMDLTHQVQWTTCNVHTYGSVIQCLCGCRCGRRWLAAVCRRRWVRLAVVC